MVRVAVIALVLLGGCATMTPRQRAEGECERQVANDMGYDVSPDGTWRERTGHSGGGDQIAGSGTRIGECLRARGF